MTETPYTLGAEGGSGPAPRWVVASLLRAAREAHDPRLAGLALALGHLPVSRAGIARHCGVHVRTVRRVLGQCDFLRDTDTGGLALAWDTAELPQLDDPAQLVIGFEAAAAPELNTCTPGQNDPGERVFTHAQVPPQVVPVARQVDDPAPPAPEFVHPDDDPELNTCTPGQNDPGERVFTRAERSGGTGVHPPAPEAFEAWIAHLQATGAGELAGRFRWQDGAIWCPGRMYADFAGAALPGLQLRCDAPADPPPPPASPGTPSTSPPTPQSTIPVPASPDRVPPERAPGEIEAGEAGSGPLPPLAEAAEHLAAAAAQLAGDRRPAPADAWLRMLQSVARSVDRHDPRGPGWGERVAEAFALAAYHQGARSGFCWLDKAADRPRLLLRPSAWQALGQGWGVPRRSRMRADLAGSLLACSKRRAEAA